MKFLRATGYAISLKDMFINYPLKKLKMTCEECLRINGGDAHRDRLAAKIFKENVKMVFNDIIDNNVTFELPTGSRKSDIHMQVYEGDAFKNLRKAGKWRDVDFLKSNFTGYQLGLFMYSPKRPPRVKKIYVSRYLRDKITEHTNNGKTYC